MLSETIAKVEAKNNELSAKLSEIKIYQRYLQILS